jgi:hypothetical protein
MEAEIQAQIPGVDHVISEYSAVCAANVFGATCAEHNRAI